MSDCPLGQEDLDFYWKNGYTVVRDLIEAEKRDRWLERLDDLVEGRVEPSENMLIMKDVMVAKGAVQPASKQEAIAKIQDYEKDPVLDTYTTDDNILDCIEQIIGHDVQTIHTMLINKPPNVDGRHPLHQDLFYFPFRPADRIVASWTALERITKENGCLVVVPGTHRGELLEHGNPDIEHLNMGYFGAKGIEDEIEKRVHLEMEPGDTVFFHPILIHGSGRNRTQHFRRAISAHYTALDVEWAWTQGEAFNKRQYRIVRGDRQGELWNGSREGGTLNQLDYIKIKIADDQAGGDSN